MLFIGKRLLHPKHDNMLMRSSLLGPYGPWVAVSRLGVVYMPMTWPLCGLPARSGYDHTHDFVLGIVVVQLSCNLSDEGCR